MALLSGIDIANTTLGSSALPVELAAVAEYAANPQQPSSRRHRLVLLDTACPAAAALSALFRASLTSSLHEVTAIRLVVNAGLVHAYAAAALGTGATGPGDRLAFHFTKPQTLPLLLEGGFDSSYCGTSAAAAWFGVGHYLSQYGEYAIDGYGYELQDVTDAATGTLLLRWARRSRRRADGVEELKEAFVLRPAATGEAAGTMGKMDVVGHYKAGSGAVADGILAGYAPARQSGIAPVLTRAADLALDHGALSLSALLPPGVGDVHVTGPFYRVLVCQARVGRVAAVARADVAGRVCGES